MFDLREATLAAVLVAPGASTSHASTDPETVPDGVGMLMERGGVPAVFDPAFVPADSANLPDDAFVLGVTLGEDSKAYSLNLLNHHEVVNDAIGEKQIAAIW